MLNVRGDGCVLACLGGVWGDRGLEMRKLCLKWGCGVGGGVGL